MAAVDIDEPKITYAHETPVKNPSQSEMSNFAGYPHLQRSEADVEEDLGERAQLRLDVEHSPFASYGAAGLLAPLPPSGHRKKAKRRRKRDKATTGSLASFSDEVRHGVRCWARDGLFVVHSCVICITSHKHANINNILIQNRPGAGGS